MHAGATRTYTCAAPAELYLQYNNYVDSTDKYGGLERIDPITLRTLAKSPRLDAGGHTWCGGVVVHENGFLYMNIGNRCFKLDADCNVVAVAILPQDTAYNSLLVMHDGCLAMKNIERDRARLSKFVVLEPHRLEQVATEVPIPENSMGLIAMNKTPAGQLVYVQGTSATSFRSLRGHDVFTQPRPIAANPGPSALLLFLPRL